jgi:proteic killer suppression protein
MLQLVAGRTTRGKSKDNADRITLLVIQWNQVIKSFADKRTKALFETGKSRRWSSIARAAVRKLVRIDSVVTLDELLTPPGNRLEALKGDRAGQHSIRINEQWRICFRWESDGAYEVEIVDYQ